MSFCFLMYKKVPLSKSHAIHAIYLMLYLIHVRAECGKLRWWIMVRCTDRSPGALCPGPFARGPFARVAICPGRKLPKGPFAQEESCPGVICPPGHMHLMFGPVLWACWVWALRAQTQQAQTWRHDLGLVPSGPNPSRLYIGALRAPSRGPTGPCRRARLNLT